jgi:hypothetical protein
LELAIQALEQQHDASSGATSADPTNALLPLLADSARVDRTLVGPGISVAMQRGYVPAPVCLSRVREMLEGITPLAPMLTLNDGNVYVRDLHERDTLVSAMYPGRPIYFLRGAGLGDGALPFFELQPLAASR